MSNKTDKVLQVLVFDTNGNVINTIAKEYLINYEIVSYNKMRVFVNRLDQNSNQWIKAVVNFEIRPCNQHVYDAVMEWSSR